MKKKTKKFILEQIEDYQDSKIINLFCFDNENPNHEHNSHLVLQSYPPIGAIINFGHDKPFFKIDSLQIQIPNGNNCLAYGYFFET